MCIICNLYNIIYCIFYDYNIAYHSILISFTSKHCCFPVTIKRYADYYFTADNSTIFNCTIWNTNYSLYIHRFMFNCKKNSDNSQCVVLFRSLCQCLALNNAIFTFLLLFWEVSHRMLLLLFLGRTAGLCTLLQRQPLSNRQDI